MSLAVMVGHDAKCFLFIARMKVDFVGLSKVPT